MGNTNSNEKSLSEIEEERKLKELYNMILKKNEKIIEDYKLRWYT